MARTKTKTCTRCQTEQKVTAFYRDKSTKSGYATWCKSCEREYDREYRARKREEATA